MPTASKQLGTQPIPRLLFKQSLPAIIGMMVFALYNVVDTIFIGRGVGTLGIAGVAIALPITMIIHGLGMTFGLGAASIISRSLGAKNKEKANQIYTNFLFLTVGTSVIASVALFFLLEPALALFGATETILPYARDYLLIVIIGVPFFSFAGAASHVIRSEGAAMKAMKILLVGTIINIVLDPIFIFGLDMGIKGAAWATVIAHIVSAAFVIAYYASGKSAVRITTHCRLCWSHIKEITVIGSPSLFRMTSMNIIAIVINVLLAKHSGDLAIAAYGVINRFIIFSVMPVIGLVQGMQPIIGYNFGARKFARVKEATTLSMRVATYITVSAFIGFFVFARQVVSIFTTDQALIDLSVHVTRIIVLVFPLIGFQIVAGGYYQALGKARAALFLTLLRQVVVFLPVLLILPSFWGVEGVWWAFPIADVVAAAVTAIVIRKSLRQLNRGRKTPSR